MKLLALNASHRGERGITARLLSLLGEGALRAGPGFETLTLAGLRINRVSPVTSASKARTTCNASTTTRTMRAWSSAA